MSYISCSMRWLRQRPRRHGRISGGADKLGYVVEPVPIEVVDQPVAQEITRHEQRGLRIHRATTSMGGRSSLSQQRSSGGPSQRMEGCSDEPCCSWLAGPVPAYATSDGGR